MTKTHIIGLLLLLVIVAGAIVFSFTRSQAPPNGVIAYQVSNGVDPSEIHLFSVTSKGDRTLAANDSGSYGPAWSPDGKSIAFYSDRDGHLEIYIMTADGQSQHRLTSTDHDNLNPNWSPDGDSIVYDSCHNNGAECEIYVIDVDGKNPHRVSTIVSTGYNFPVWSPDGKYIAFNSNFDQSAALGIYVMDADGKNVRRLTRRDTFAVNPAWSPDGRYIAFTDLHSIYIVEVDSGFQRDLSRHADPGNDKQPAWSPDGKYIVFCSDRERKPGLWLMDADGNNQYRITAHPANFARPAWHP